MSESLGSHLFQSAGRTAILHALLVRGVRASVSELARRAGLSPRAMGREVEHLASTGLVVVERWGNADVVRANPKHPAVRPLRLLLSLPSRRTGEDDSEQTCQSLAGWGAPLAGVRPGRHFTLEETVLRGLVEARTDGTVLRVLPTLVALNLGALDWVVLLEGARRRKLKAELGFVLEVCALLTGQAEPRERAASLMDRRRRTMRFFPEVKSRFEAALAKQRSPAVATRWGFWMNMSDESFRVTHERHA